MADSNEASSEVRECAIEVYHSCCGRAIGFYRPSEGRPKSGAPTREELVNWVLHPGYYIVRDIAEAGLFSEELAPAVRELYQTAHGQCPGAFPDVGFRVVRMSDVERKLA